MVLRDINTRRPINPDTGDYLEDGADLMPLDEMVGTMPHPDEHNWRGITQN